MAVAHHHVGTSTGFLSVGVLLAELHARIGFVKATATISRIVLCRRDLLVTNQNPAMMSRYVLSAGQRLETHASSGMWISTPAGSTAGIRSAGGTVMPLEGSLIQYLVREPYTAGPARYPLLKGVRELEEGLMLRSLMEGGVVYVDGPYIQIPFQLGAELRLIRGPSLRVVGLDPARRER